LEKLRSSGKSSKLAPTALLGIGRISREPGDTRAVTLIRPFGSALGAYLLGTQPPAFRRIEPGGTALLERIAERFGRALAIDIECCRR